MTTEDEIAAIAERNGVSREAVEAAREALERGGGTMAQLSHADFGGMAQWSKGGMSMVGDLFDSALKGRFDRVMAELAALRDRRRAMPAEAGVPAAAAPAGGSWWPEGLGSPSTSGGQNSLRYAYFPQARRLVIEEDGRRRVYDTGEHRITGVSQQQGDTRTLAFATASGRVRLEDLVEVGEDR
jgi:hypothetical protein